MKMCINSLLASVIINFGHVGRTYSLHYNELIIITIYTKMHKAKHTMSI